MADVRDVGEVSDNSEVSEVSMVSENIKLVSNLCSFQAFIWTCRLQFPEPF